MNVKAKKKMNKKLIASIVVLALVSLASIAGIVTVLALTQRSIDSAIFIRFTAIDIDGEVEAQYRVGTGEWKPMGEKHVFNAADEEENAQMNPGNITLSSANNFVEFKYTFRNFGDADYTGLLTLDEVDQNDNMEIQYKYNDAEYSTSSYGLVVEGVDSASADKLKDRNGEKYTEMTYYIKVGVKELSKSASYSSDFFWLLERYDGEVSGEVLPLATSTYVANGDGTYTAKYNGSNISTGSTSAGENGISNVWIVPNNIGSAAVTKVAKGNDLPANTKVVLGDNVTTIEYKTFNQWMDDSIWVIRECTGLVEIVLGKGMTEIPGSCFYGCPNLKNITFGENVTSIGSSAFYNCESLTSIVIPECVTSIGGSAFESCDNLKEITIPSSVTTIGGGAFTGCKAVEELNYNANVITAFSSSPFSELGNNATKTVVNINSITIPSKLFYNCSSIDEVNITNATMIGSEAFSNCINLTSIKFPDNLSGIEDSAFQSCTKLASVIIPDSVTSIGNKVFKFCSGLKSVLMGGNILSIGDYAFESCSCLTSVEIPDSVTSIGEGAFSICGLTEIKVPDSVTSIGNMAFALNSGLTSVFIGSGVTSIGNSYLFSSCDALTSIEVDVNNTTYASEGNCLLNKEKTTLIIGCKTSVIPNSVTTIGDNAFAIYSSLTSIVIPSSVTSIGKGAFGNCWNLTSVEFKNPNGWWYADSVDATSGTSFSVSATDFGANATLLTSTYASKYWKRG